MRMDGWYLKSKGVWGAVIVVLAAVYKLYSGDELGAAALFGIGLSLLGIRHAQEKRKRRK